MFAGAWQRQLLWPCLSLLFWITSARSEALRRPVLMVISGDEGTIRSSSSTLSRRATAGREAYAGEALESGPQAITFAYCLGATQSPAVYVLAAHSSLQVGPDFLAEGASVQQLKRLPVCDFPQIASLPLASTLDDPRTRSVPSGSVEHRLQMLSPEYQAHIRDSLSKSDELIRTGSYSLIGHSTRAAVFEKFGLLDDALAELRIVRDGWFEATWTRDVITRLNGMRITQPDPQSDENGGGGVTVEPAVSRFDPSKGKTYALLIGISEYESKRINPLHWADKDAEAFRDYLTSARGGKLNPDQVELLLNQKATRDGIEKAISDLVRGKANRNNTLIIFVAAHGALLCTHAAVSAAAAVTTCNSGAEEPFILTFDTDPDEGKTTGVPMAEFRQMVTARARDFGRVIVFVDVCHAGRIASLPESTRLSSPDLNDAFGNGTGMLGILMGNSVARSLQDELTYERSSYGHGIFTYYTLLGLNHEVQPSDGKIYFTNLSNYVSDRVVNATHRKQRPSAFNPDPDLVAVDDATKEGIQLTGSNISTEQDSPRRADLSANSGVWREFEDALKGGRLLPGEKGSAFDLLQQIRQGLTSDAQFQLAAGSVRVALEQQGQAIILKYLKGDEVPQLESDFLLGARYFRAALDLAPDAAFDESRFLFCQGRAEIFQKKYSAAQRTLDASISIDPARAYAYNAIGIAYLEQVTKNASNIALAISAFQTAIGLAPYWAYPRHNLALTYAEAGEFDQAVRQYQEARLLAPSYGYLAYNLGVLYQQINEVPAARAAYVDALQLSERDCSVTRSASCPAAARVRTALGVLFETTSKWNLAEKQYQMALRADSRQLDAKHDLASLWTRSNRHAREAEQMWQDNLQVQPGHVPSLMGLSDLLHKAQRSREALPLYERLIALRPQYVPGIIALADVRTATGNPGSGLALLEEKRTLAEHNSEFWLAHARATLARRDFVSARLDYRKAVQMTKGRRNRNAIEAEFKTKIPFHP
jgi:tetratricopeptide (TPR) repeat protein